MKSRIRDLKRLLEHVDNVPKHKMSATQRVERERELETCEHDLAEKIAAGQEAAFRNKMISKYHQIRFFDRRKAERNLKKLKRELSLSEDHSQKSDLQRRTHNAEVDLNYAIYYPLLKPYSSLYPNAKQEKNKTEEATDSDDAQGQQEEVVGPKGDHTVWKAVEEAMKSGTLADLRNSKQKGTTPKPEKGPQDKKKSKSGVKGAQGNSRLSQKRDDTHTSVNTQEGQEEDDSDGGFFE